jgi:hypothetical protein
MNLTEANANEPATTVQQGVGLPWGRRAAALKITLAAPAVLALALLGVTPLLAQPVTASGTNASANASLRAERLLPGERLTLDGSLSHTAWQRAAPYTRFVEQQPHQGSPAPQQTSVRVLFDDKALYIGVMAHDTQPALIRDLPVRYDGVNRTQDFVVAYIDAIGLKTSAQFFRVNAAGSLADGIHTAADDSEDFSPDFDWDARVQRHADGWSTVMRIPLASLRYADDAAPSLSGPGTRPWRFMLGRRLPREQVHLMLSVDLPRGSPSFIDKLQALEGVKLPAHAQFLTIRPSFTLRQSRERADATSPSPRSSALDTSLDIKWRPSAEWVIDATVKPDFSQVALDVPQLTGNSRFALFLPEKRPFFFESADLLRSPTDALYTRSITQPRAGARATWRSSSWQGTALAASDKGGGTVLLPGPYGTDGVVQPASIVWVARLRHPSASADGVSWGGLVASRRYEQGRGDNHVLGADAEAGLGHGWRLRSQALLSHTSALATDGELRQGNAQQGHRGYLYLQHLDEGSETSVTLDSISPRFRHDTGFVNQAGLHSVGAHRVWKWERVGPFNQFELYADVRHTQAAGSGEGLDRWAYVGLWTSGARNLEWWLEWHPWSLTRTGPGRAALRTPHMKSGLVYTPAPWFPLLDTQLSVGRLPDTTADRARDGVRWNLTAKLRPSTRWELEPSLSSLWLKDSPLGLAAAGRQTLYRESALQVLAVWHLRADQNLRLITQRQQLQRRPEAGIAEQRSSNSAASLTWQWRRSAGTQLFVGVSRSAESAGGPRSTEAFVKLQLDADEALSTWRRP